MPQKGNEQVAQSLDIFIKTSTSLLGREWQASLSLNQLSDEHCTSNVIGMFGSMKQPRILGSVSSD